MKTERRHELQHNELADRLALLIESAMPYGRVIGGVALLVVVAVAIIAYRANSTATYNAAGWDDYYAAFNQGSEEKLTEVAKKYPGSPVAEWSKLIASDMLLGQGIEQLFTDKSQGKGKLQDAADGYQSVLLNATTPLVKQRALFGLARAYESRGELPKAREQYEQLVKDFPDCAFSATAKARIKVLEGDDAKQFYDWFASYEPPKSSGASTPGSKPFFDLPSDIDTKDPLPRDTNPDGGASELPTTDSLLEDNLPGGIKPAEGAAEEGAADDGAATTDAPAEKAPADTAPADTAPAEEAPAAEKPAAEKPAEANKK